jgi:hypothetical protein
VHSLLRSPPVNAAADSGTANALAKIKARSMVFLSRVVYQAVCRRIQRARHAARRSRHSALFTGPQQRGSRYLQANL